MAGIITEDNAGFDDAAPKKDRDRHIVRDNTFVRAVADDIVPLLLGRDVELSCLQFSPILHTMFDKGDHYMPDGDEVYTEVARIRVSIGESVEMAMRILGQGIKSGQVRGDKVAETIAQWAREEADKQKDSSGDD